MTSLSEKSVNPKDVTDKQVELLFTQAPISNTTIYIIALLFFFLLQNYSETITHILWPVLMACVASYRLFLWYLRKKAPKYYTSNGWMQKYVIGSAITGVAWSSIFFFPFINQDIVLYGALIMIFFGVTASAVSILSVSLPAFFSYTIPILVAFIFAVHHQGGATYIFFTIIAIIYYSMLTLFARNTYKQTINSINLQFQNQILIHQLQQEVEQRETLIKARTKELEKSNLATIDTKTRLQNVITGAELGYWDWNYPTGHYEVNDRWLEILGLNREDVRNDVSDWETRIHPDDKEQLFTVVDESIKNNKPYVADFRMKHKNGQWIWIQGSGSLIESDEITHKPLRLCGTHQNVSCRKKMEMDLEYRAKHDSLTNLFNRVEMEKYFQEELIRAERYQHSLSIFMIDIDHFKLINDTYGHQSGDQVLQQFANFLQETVRSIDYVARYGGEEFVVILPETSNQKARELAERLRIKTTQLTIEFKDISHNITISLGISSFPEHGKSYCKLLEMADSAMYQAKQNGRNQVRSVEI